MEGIETKHERQYMEILGRQKKLGKRNTKLGKKKKRRRIQEQWLTERRKRNENRWRESSRWWSFKMIYIKYKLIIHACFIYSVSWYSTYIATKAMHACKNVWVVADHHSWLNASVALGLNLNIYSLLDKNQSAASRLQHYGDILISREQSIQCILTGMPELGKQLTLPANPARSSAQGRCQSAEHPITPLHRKATIWDTQTTFLFTQGCVLLWSKKQHTLETSPLTRLSITSLKTDRKFSTRYFLP